MAGLYYTPLALSDLAAIHKYIRQFNPSAADRQIRALLKACEILADFPGMSQSRPMIAPGIQSWPCGAYLVFHRERRDSLEILRVFHGAQNIKVEDLSDLEDMVAALEMEG